MKFLAIAAVALFAAGAQAVTLPDTITATAKFVSPGAPTIIDDVNGVMVATFMNTVGPATYTADPRDFLDLGKASSKEFLNPALGGCVLLDYSFDYFGMGNSIFMVGGRDPQGNKDCQNFVKAASDGFQIKFTDVPLLNRGGVIKTLYVNVTN